MDIEKHSDSTYFILAEVMRLHYIRLHSLLDDIGLYQGQSRLLFVLVHHGDGLSQKELSEKLNISPATLTVMIKRMEKAGLLYRRQDKEDQRVWRVYVSDEGRASFKECLVILDIIGQDCFGNLTEEEIDSLDRILGKVKDNLEASLEEK